MVSHHDAHSSSNRRDGGLMRTHRNAAGVPRCAARRRGGAEARPEGGGAGAAGDQGQGDGEPPSGARGRGRGRQHRRCGGESGASRRWGGGRDGCCVVGGRPCEPCRGALLSAAASIAPSEGSSKKADDEARRRARQRSSSHACIGCRGSHPRPSLSSPPALRCGAAASELIM